MSDKQFTILGRGGNGCVFTLGRNSFDNHEYVGKMKYSNIHTWSDGQLQDLSEFMNIQNKIFASDPDERYFITTRDIVKMKVYDDQIRECNMMKPRRKVGRPDPEDYDIFVQRRVNVAPDPSTWSKTQADHALQGLFLLHSLGFVHGDIAFKNFGFLNGNPVYIDMDSVMYAKRPSIRERDGRSVIELDDTAEKDIFDLSDMFIRQFK